MGPPFGILAKYQGSGAATVRREPMAGQRRDPGLSQSSR